MIRIPRKAQETNAIRTADGRGVACRIFKLGGRYYMKAAGMTHGKPISAAEYESLEKAAELQRRKWS